MWWTFAEIIENGKKNCIFVLRRRMHTHSCKKAALTIVSASDHVTYAIGLHNQFKHHFCQWQQPFTLGWHYWAGTDMSLTRCAATDDMRDLASVIALAYGNWQQRIAIDDDDDINNIGSRNTHDVYNNTPTVGVRCAFNLKPHYTNKQTRHITYLLTYLQTCPLVLVDVVCLRRMGHSPSGHSPCTNALSSKSPSGTPAL